MRTSRTGIPALCLSLLLCSCGGGALSLTEYTERINTIEAQASEQGESLAASVEEVDDFTPQDLQTVLERARIIRVDVDEAVANIDPPEQVADVHDLVFNWHAEFIAVEEALAVRAGSTPHGAAGWNELSASSEMEAYRRSIAEGKHVCIDFQDRLDATEARGAFAETPWIPGEMKEAVERVLGCIWFPDNPEDVYRYPPMASTS